jgi:hypothetical protein
VIGQPDTAARRRQSDAFAWLVRRAHQALEFVERRLDVPAGFLDAGAKTGIDASESYGDRVLPAPGCLQSGRQSGSRLVYALIV